MKPLTISFDAGRVRNKLLNGILIFGLIEVSVNQEWSDDTGSLRRFALALARDERFVLDDVSAARLVDKLIKQTSVAPIVEGVSAELSGRARVFARFIQLHRRHVRRLTNDELDTGWSENGGRGPAVVIGVRALPLELREALLLVVLGGFSHKEAAQALDIPLIRLRERLERARSRLARHMGVPIDAAPQTGWAGAPHLRVIK